MARNAKWDYDQSQVFEIGTASQPDLFRININTKSNSLTQEEFSKLEAKMMEVILTYNP